MAEPEKTVIKVPFLGGNALFSDPMTFETVCRGLGVSYYEWVPVIDTSFLNKILRHSFEDRCRDAIRKLVHSKEVLDGNRASDEDAVASAEKVLISTGIPFRTGLKKVELRTTPPGTMIISSPEDAIEIERNIRKYDV